MNKHLIENLKTDLKNGNLNQLGFTKFIFNRLIVLLLLASGYTFATQGDPAETSSLPLWNDLGTHQYPISTESKAAQDYFRQGLILSYGFNHAESATAFREAAKHDPDCAMCFWGEALVLGPNINAPMADEAVPKAWNALVKAQSLAAKTKPNEKALIQALSKRYSNKAVKDRTKLDAEYADAMREVAKQFPDDAVILALFAEALMDSHPWNYWTKEGNPQPWTPELIATLESALEIDQDNPLANHLYIHAMEASNNPEKALPSAKRLPNLVPGSGHLVHMPAHIYIRLGHYQEAAQANKAAVKVDHNYLNHSHTKSLYTLAYVPHNLHFLWAAAIKSGQSQLATQSAAQTAAKVDLEMMHKPGFGSTLQHFWLTPLFTQALFGQWDEILQRPAPDQDLLYPTAIWHYARGLAFLRREKPEQARQELQELKRIVHNPAIEKLTIFDLNSIKDILRIAEAILAGEIAVGQKDYKEAIGQLQQAVQIEDSLNYTEPKDWYLPPRQVLGAILLEAREPVKAEAVYRKDLEFHPQNGWSLFGLQQSLMAQKKITEAKETETTYSKAWKDADIKLTASRY